MNGAGDLLVGRIRERRVIPFVGAGLSTGMYPNWEQLLERLWTGTTDLRAMKAERGPTVVAEMLAAGRIRSELARDSAVVMKEWQRTNPAAAAYRASHSLVATGPWPAILTTNWDDALERAFEARGPHLRYAHALPVRFRRDARRFYAEVKAGIRPGPLLKLHGDLGARSDEFVLGHGDYRRLMTRDVELRSLIRWLASEYSFLFYGTSLTDPDLLAWLDETHESLGHAVGPHFWLTGEVFDPRFETFLLNAYGIRTLRLPTWTEADAHLARRITEAVSGSVTDMAVTATVGQLRVTLSSTELPVNTTDALGVSVGVMSRRGGTSRRALAGATFQAVYGTDKAPRLDHVVPGCATVWPENGNRWLLFGQEEGAFGRTGYVHSAVLECLRQAERLGHDRVHLPLVAGGGGRLAPHDALASELHAIGRFSAELRRPMAVELHLPPGPPSTRGLVADLADGRVVPGPILARGRQGVARVTVIYPTRAGDLQALVVQVPWDATAGTLWESLIDATEPTSLVRFQDGYQASPWDPSARLDALHVTDGCIVTLVRAPDPKV